MKKTPMKKTPMKKTPMIIVSALILILVVGAIAAYFLISPKTIYENTYKPTWTQETLGSLEIDEGVVGYTLAQFEAYKLHNVPLTSNNPKIEVIIDGEVYFVEIDGGNIIPTKGESQNEDIRISMTREDVIEILNESNDVIAEIRESVNDGTTSVETVASKTELLAKGYLSIYNKFTGEEL